MGSTIIGLAAATSVGAVPIAAVRPALGRRMLLVAVGLLWVAAAMIVAALVREDTSLAIVVDNTRPGLDPFRRAMGLWGGSAGSLLLFTAVVGSVLAVAPTDRRAAIAGPLVVASLAGASFFVASPFERLDNPAIAGSGLSPILEHWAMLIHPPLLYIGLALSLVPAVAHPARTPRWTRAAIVVLTAALALGGGWAYVELGWGGWWAWDPVENAALIPWLLMVVQLHLSSRHPAARVAALLCWPAVIGGAAMTRTSLRTSVHAFADAESLRWVLWPLTVVVALGAIALLVTDERVRAHTTRERATAATLLTYSAIVVALGTFRPFVPGDSTDGTFYSRALFVVAIAGPVLLGVAPRWRRESRQRLAIELVTGAVIGSGAAIVAGWTEWYQMLLAASLAAGVVTVLADVTAARARTAAHVGMILVLAGALGGTASTTRTVGLAVGESFEISGHTVTNLGSGLVGESPPVLAADVLIDSDRVLSPSVTVYAERGLRLPEVATLSRPWEDLQVILRSADDDGSALLTANVQPLTQLVWYGAALLCLGVASSTPRRRDPAAITSLPVSRAEPAAAR